MVSTIQLPHIKKKKTKQFRIKNAGGNSLTRRRLVARGKKRIIGNYFLSVIVFPHIFLMTLLMIVSEQ